MKSDIDLKAADRKVFTAGFEDGLVDIFIASVVLMFAIAPFLSVYLGDFWSSAIFVPFWGIVYLVLRWIRNNEVKPRIGYVKFGPARKKKMTIFTWIMLAINVLFLIFVLFAASNFDTPGWMRVVPFSAMLLFSFSLAGYFLDITRLYGYGLMLAGGFFVGEWLYQTFSASHHGYPIVFGVSAGLIFLIGLIKLITFINNNPLPVHEAMQWEGDNG